MVWGVRTTKVTPLSHSMVDSGGGGIEEIELSAKGAEDERHLLASPERLVSLYNRFVNGADSKRSKIAVGANVTVSNLTVTAKQGLREKGKAKKCLLDNVSLYLKPGEMTLILGAPGCGKSTLFEVLANHLDNGAKKQIGKVMFENKGPTPHLHQRTVAYVTQDDLHFPTMTVRQTLEFSLACQTPEFMNSLFKDEMVDVLLEILDLKHVQHTPVGNELVRGVSGGQRKRVTIGVALTKAPQLVLLDEPSTGLDANMTLSLSRAIRNACDALQLTALVAMLQPSPDVCKMFDNLLILHEGQVAYFGPYSNAIEYFENLGLRGSIFQSDPEFLQEVVANCHMYDARYKSNDLLAIYKESKESQAALQTISDIEATTKSSESSPLLEKVTSRYTLSFWGQLKINFWREFLLFKQDKLYPIARAALKIILSLIIGSLFYQLSHEQTGLSTRLAVLFFAILFFCLSSVAMIVPFFRARAVFYYQRNANYYSPLSYFLAKTMMDSVMFLYEDILFAVGLYWMVGLNPEPDRFVYFVLLIFAVEFFAVNSCKFCSGILPTENVAMSVAPSLFMGFAQFSGFLIKPPDIPDWWIWIYHLSPFHYAFEGVLINEFSGSTYSCSPNEMVPPAIHPLANIPYPIGYQGSALCLITKGEQQLEALDMHTDFSYRWVDFAIVLGFAVFMGFLTFLGMQYKYFPSKVIRPESKKFIPQADENRKSKTIKVEEKKYEHGVFLSWNNVSYSVDIKKGKKKEQLRLLNNLTGFVKPGMLMALMGPSGAGKSTLLDVLARRKTGGHIEGSIMVNGKPQDKYFSRYSGYVEQTDVLLPLQTVREAIIFSAEARLPQDLTKDQKMAKVDETIRLLNLENIQHLRGNSLSIEQKKRLSIGVELVTDPKLLFLDEPTSGLDSQAALIVMEVVKEISATGRSVICTIHQPSAHVFSYFDHVFLLKRGGETVYFGPTGKNCDEILGYFASIGWKSPPKKNPADFILDVASVEGNARKSADVESGYEVGFDPVVEYEKSTLRIHMESLCVFDSSLYDPLPTYRSEYTASLSTQLKMNIERGIIMAYRCREDWLGRVMKNLIMSILIGTCFLQLADDQGGAQNRFAAIFFLTMCCSINGAFVVPIVVNGRSVFYREDATKTTKPLAYLAGLSISEMIVTFVTLIFFMVPAYFLMGLDSSASTFFIFWFIALAFSYQQVTYTHLMSFVSPNGEVAQQLVFTCAAIYALFCGFIITKPQLPEYWVWMYYVSFMHYPVEALLVNEMDEKPFYCPEGKGAIPIPINYNNTLVLKEYCPIPSGNIILSSLSINPNHFEQNVYIIIGTWLGFLILCFVSLKYVRFLKR